MKAILSLALLAVALAAQAQTQTARYTQTSTTGLTTSTATLPALLEDVNFATGSTLIPQRLSGLTFGYGVLPNTAAQTGTVFFDFYDTFTPTSTGSVVSNYIGGFGGTLTITANTSTTATALRAGTFATLQTLATPIDFKDDNIAVVITFGDATGTNYSSVLTPLTSNPGTPTVGSSVAGVYRDLNSDGTFQSNELNTTLGNAYLSISTVNAVPEPATMAVLGLGALGVLRRRRKSA